MMTGKIHFVRFLNTLWIYAIALVLTSAYFYQFEEHEAPCPLCLIQRLCMICMAIGPMLNLRFRIRVQHYSLSIFAIILGGATSLRQIGLHVCPGFSTFGYPIFGLSLYTWAFLVFSASLLGIAILLLFHPREDQLDRPYRMYIHEKIAFGYIFVISVMSIFTTLEECGLGACKG